jgi:hypothetical protein
MKVKLYEFNHTATKTYAKYAKLQTTFDTVYINILVFSV